MRPIKFRGRNDSGKFVYGDLTHVANMVSIGGWHVDPDSIAQLVGYDKDGNEVYEGDTYTDERGTFTAKLTVSWERGMLNDANKKSLKENQS